MSSENPPDPEWDAIVSYVLKRLKNESAFEIDSDIFEKELDLSGDYQLKLLNRREGGSPMMFDFKTIPESAATPRRFSFSALK